MSAPLAIIAAIMLAGIATLLGLCLRAPEGEQTDDGYRAQHEVGL